MLKMQLEKEGKKVIDTKMISTTGTFGQIYVDIVLIEEDEQYIIRGVEEKYACLSTKTFNQEQAQKLFEAIKCI